MEPGLSRGLSDALERHLSSALALGEPSDAQLCDALARAVRETLATRWRATQEAQRGAREVAYLSMEFHLGRLLRSAAQSLELTDACQEALDGYGAKLEAVEEREADPGLGSGGLGRLAACFLDSLATHDLPARGYGLRYELGLFRQSISNGAQEEEPDPWLARPFPWEIACPQDAVQVSFGGRVEFSQDQDGTVHHSWVDTETLVAIPHDVLIPGYGTETVGTLRLWAAHATGVGLTFDAFQQGDHVGARHAEDAARAITTFLYPADDHREGKLLRLRQQYLLSSASLQDLLRRHLATGAGVSTLAERFAVQLNDTHPALSIPELMRLLIDEHGMGWEQAWDLTRRVFAYTNHTLLPEALETWSTDLLAELLPRHMQIVREIDRRFHEELRSRYPGDGDRVRRMAIVEVGNGEQVRMAHLCVLGSHTVNGVAALHTQLLREGLLKDFCELAPERFTNKTNGITPRRWLKQANPGLARLIDGRIGPDWVRDLDRLRDLEPLADDADFRAEFRAVKQANKERLAVYIRRHAGVEVDPTSLFDVQIKRFHEYKRQLLLVLWIVHRALALRANPDLDVPKRTVIFAGKAAASYHRAKEIIRLIHAVAAAVNGDERVNGKLRVAFLPNYSVSQAEVIVPAADLSEQISTAGYEASGTGNMKLSLNGALTIGTLDGANVEIREEVGEENVFVFGLEAHEVRALREEGDLPRERVEQQPLLRAVLDAIEGSQITPEAPGSFAELIDTLLDTDTYMLLADFAAYCAAQERVEALYRDPEAWTAATVRTTARMGKFSSDRTIREYAEGIWRLTPVRVPRRGEGTANSLS